MVDAERPPDRARWSAGRLLRHAILLALITVVRAYQLVISPWLGCNCRFTPSCSQYCLEALGKHGILRGLWMTARRIMRCHPFHPGGVDPP